MNDLRFNEEDFPSFLEDCIRAQKLERKEEGIARLAIDKGWAHLSDKQKYVLKQALAPFIYDECSFCGDEIPWCEMAFAEINGQNCSGCYHQLNKDD